MERRRIGRHRFIVVVVNVWMEQMRDVFKRNSEPIGTILALSLSIIVQAFVHWRNGEEVGRRRWRRGKRSDVFFIKREGRESHGKLG
jgi:hypothetical protein